MAEVLVQIDEPLRTPDGRFFVAQVHGAHAATGLWEAWIEFTPRDGGDPVRTDCETEQLTRGDLRYWAAGLTRADLAGALARALSPARVSIPHGLAIPDPAVVLPREDAVAFERGATRVATPPVLDPMEVFRRSGEYALRHELRALNAHELRDIISAFAIPDMDVTDLARTFEDALAERIVAGVQQRAHASRKRAPATSTARSTK